MEPGWRPQRRLGGAKTMQCAWSSPSRSPGNAGDKRSLSLRAPGFHPFALRSGGSPRRLLDSPCPPGPKNKNRKKRKRFFFAQDVRNCAVLWTPNWCRHRSRGSALKESRRASQLHVLAFRAVLVQRYTKTMALRHLIVVLLCAVRLLDPADVFLHLTG